MGWLEWISFDPSKLNFLHTPLEKAGSKIELSEWNTYLDWKIEASKINKEKFSSQGINEGVQNCSVPDTPLPSLAAPLFHVLPFQDLPSLSLLPLFYTSYTLLSIDLGKTKSIKLDQK